MLFAAAKKLLNYGDKRIAFPPSVDKLEFANQMGSYFVEKTHHIHTNQFTPSLKFITHLKQLLI